MTRRVLVSKNIHGAGVVNKEGALVDQLSVRDLRVRVDQFTALLLPVS